MHPRSQHRRGRGHPSLSGLQYPVCLIPNGVSIPDPAPKPPAPWAEKIKDGAPVLLFLGRLHPKKNVHGLLRALAHIKATHGLGDWQTVVAGWDQAGYAARLATLVHELALEKDVVFLGPTHGAKKDAALRNANAFILPSFSEGLPMAVLEAWAYGLPVAMTQACNLPEGFNVGAAHEIAAAPETLDRDLAEFLSYSEAELSSMGKRGLGLVHTCFSWELAAEHFVAVYEWLLGGGSPPSCLWAA